MRRRVLSVREPNRSSSRHNPLGVTVLANLGIGELVMCPRIGWINLNGLFRMRFRLIEHLTLIQDRSDQSVRKSNRLLRACFYCGQFNAPSIGSQRLVQRASKPKGTSGRALISRGLRQFR